MKAKNFIIKMFVSGIFCLPIAVSNDSNVQSLGVGGVCAVLLLYVVDSLSATSGS